MTYEIRLAVVDSSAQLFFELFLEKRENTAKVSLISFSNLRDVTELIPLFGS